jgi:hypothetical protein
MTIGDYFLIVSRIFFGLVVGDIAVYFTASHFEKIFTKKLRKYVMYGTHANNRSISCHQRDFFYIITHT